jgi:hypothetical protein
MRKRGKAQAMQPVGIPSSPLMRTEAHAVSRLRQCLRFESLFVLLVICSSGRGQASEEEEDCYPLAS